jgi:serine/threonine protein kinase
LNNDDPQDQFVFQDLIGEGAYGSVYKAIHKSSGKTVAIKIVPSSGEI